MESLNLVLNNLTTKSNVHKPAFFGFMADKASLDSMKREEATFSCW